MHAWLLVLSPSVAVDVNFFDVVMFAAGIAFGVVWNLGGRLTPQSRL
jgi:hypothetical protein